MNSSTSSFRKTEWKVIAVVLLVIAGWEICARCIGPYLDYDRVHIHTFDQLSTELSQGPAPRVLFLGNSLTRAGVDMNIVQDQLSGEGIGDISMQKFQPVGTDILDWLFLYKRYIKDAGIKPDVVVIAFAKHHIGDRPPKRLRRLGRHFITAGSMDELFEKDIDNFGDKSEIFLSHYFSSFGDQLLHQEGMLYCCIPYYASATSRLNNMLEAVQDKKLASERNGSPMPPETFTRIERMLEMLNDEGTHAILVAIPLPQKWTPDPKLVELTKAAGMTFIDPQDESVFTEEHFEDGYHMNDSGKKIYSSLMADLIKAQLNKKVTVELIIDRN